jgi:hypothetical protein
MMEKLRIPYQAVVEPQQVADYAKVMPRSKILATPHQDEGLVVTRNWIWDYARDKGYEKFWTFDDNIREMFRLNKNLKVRMTSGTHLRIIEDFAARYTNLPIVGMQYEMFAPRKKKWPPFVANTRVYSNMLIDTLATDKTGKPFRNEGFYNDDTDLCLRILKDGQCVILFNAFLIDKMATMSVQGGMTEHYVDDGRWKMAKELRDKHPDVVTITRKFSKWQHQVDYRRFRGNQLKKKAGLVIPSDVDNYGMKMVVRS